MPSRCSIVCWPASVASQALTAWETWPANGMSCFFALWVANYQSQCKYPEGTRLADPAQSLSVSVFTQNVEHKTAFERSTRHEVRRVPGHICRPRITPPSAFDTARDRAPAIDMNGQSGGHSPRPHWVRRAPVQRRMRSMAVIVALEIEELHLQDQRPSRTASGPDIRAEWCQSAVQRRDGKAARTAPS
jgi:hypothetical protein